MGGLIGGAMALARKSKPRAQLTEEEKRMLGAVPVVQGTQTRTREQAQQSGLIGGQYKSPKARGFFDEVMADPFTAFFAGRNGLDRKYEAQQAEQEAARMAPQQQWVDQYTQGLSGAERYAAMVNPEQYASNVAETFGKQDSKGPEIRQVGPQILERQPDGTWKPVYTGATPAETARAFQGFIDQASGEQMLVMSDGTVKGTGRKAYIPPQITSIGGVPAAVDKRTYATTDLSPLVDVAGNKAALASADVQGRAQGQAAFDLPVVEMRAQTAINSIADLKRRNIGQRFGLQGKLYAIPGTDGADVQALVNQVTSQAFLNAFEQLKGGGAITEREGQAATQAITRLQNQNITVGEALQAIDELSAYYRKGVEVARARAIQAPVLPMRPESPAGLTPEAAQRPLPQAPTRTPWLTQQTQRITGMAQPAAPAAPAAPAGLESLSLQELEALAAQLERQ